MITTLGFIFLAICLLTISVFIMVFEDSQKYKGYECYKEDFYTCLNCSKKHCQRYKLANKLEAWKDKFTN